MNKKIIFIILVFIFILSGFVSFWQLDSIPPGLYPDEAMNGNDAREALATKDFKMFYPDNNGREGLYINFIAIVFKFFGVGMWQLRFISALFGAFTVLGLYLFAKEFFYLMSAKKSKLDFLNLPGPKIKDYLPAIVSFLFAASFWRINFSRIAFRGILVPFLLTFSFYFLLKAIRKNNALDFLWSALFFGLGFHTYIAFRVAPLIVATILLIKILEYWRANKWQGLKQKGLFGIWLKDGWWKWCFYITVIIIVALPIGIYFFNNPGDFVGRAGGVSVFAQENPIKAIATSAAQTFGMFNFRGDCNWRHNYACRPQLPWTLGIFFIIGFLSLIRRFWIAIRSSNWNEILAIATIFSWFFLMLSPAIMTAEGIPHALRTIGVMPVVYIITVVGIWGTFELVKKMAIVAIFIKAIKRGATSAMTSNFSDIFGSIAQGAIRYAKVSVALYVATALFVLGVGFGEIHKYFFDWAKNENVAGAFTQDYVKIGEYLNSLPDDVNKYVLVNIGGVLVDGIPMPAQTVKFKVESSKLKVNYLLPENLENISADCQLPIIDCSIAPMKYDENIFNELLEKFPEGKIENINNITIFKTK